MTSDSGPTCVGPAPTKVLLCLLAEHAEHAEHGRVTMRSVAAAASLSLTTTAGHLRVLRRAGLVTWEAGPAGAGTLRPLVAPV